MHSLLDQAVRNNALWCEAVLRARGISSRWAGSFWLAAERAPTYYPNLITLSEAADIQAGIVELSDRLAPGWGIKDSFSCLELGDQGYSLVMSGSWYAQSEAVPEQPDAPGDVRVVLGAAELAQWLVGWGGGEPDGVPVFPPAMLNTEGVAFIHRIEDHRSVAGLVANLSDEVVGISNLFGAGEQLAACIDQARAFGRRRTLVGYGDHDELALLESFGFVALGPVRIWIRG
jgi:hypothetical protein